MRMRSFSPWTRDALIHPERLVALRDPAPITSRRGLSPLSPDSIPGRQIRTCFGGSYLSRRKAVHMDLYHEGMKECLMLPLFVPEGLKSLSFYQKQNNLAAALGVGCVRSASLCFLPLSWPQRPVMLAVWLRKKG